MQNITVSVDETVHRRARLRAAELNTSLSALVKGFLEELAGDASESEHRRRLQNELLERLDAEGRGVIAVQRPDREVLHAQARPGSPTAARRRLDPVCPGAPGIFVQATRVSRSGALSMDECTPSAPTGQPSFPA